MFPSPLRPLLALLTACAPVSIDLTDTGGDTSDTGNAAPSCGPAPRLEVRHEVDAGLLALDVAPGRAWYAAGADDVEVLSHFSNLGEVDVSYGDGNCGYPTYELRDAVGTLVWFDSNGDEVDCDEARVKTIHPGESRADQMILPPLEAGLYTLSVLHPLDLDPNDEDPTRFPAAVTVELRVGGDTCATARGNASTPPGLTLQLDAGETWSFQGSPRSLSGGARADRAIDGYFGNCGFPEFRLYDATGASIWRYSLADAADCFLKKGWAAGEETRDTTQVPGEALADPGDDQAAVQFYRWPESYAGQPQTFSLRAAWKVEYGKCAFRPS